MLDSTATAFIHEIETLLSRIRKEENGSVKLWLKKPDQYKLLKLKVWSMKYCVGVGYILNVLLPFWEGFVKRRSYRMKKAGLNVRVSTLVGKKSEAILQEHIKHDFPHGLNEILWRSTEMNRLYRIAGERDRDEFAPKAKSLLDYDTPKKYVTAYRNRMRNSQKLRETFAEEMKKYNRRENPFV